MGGQSEYESLNTLKEWNLIIWNESLNVSNEKLIYEMKLKILNEIWHHQGTDSSCAADVKLFCTDVAATSVSLLANLYEI